MAVYEYPVYTSSACNRTSRCLDWGSNGYIIYGTCHAIALYKPEECSGGRVEQTLIAHKKLVTSVQWISKQSGCPENELISTSADKTAIIWSLSNFKFVPTQTLTGHSDIVKTANGIYIQSEDEDNLLIATSSADSTVKIWERSKDNVQCNQTISFGHSFPLDVKLSFLNDSQVPLLAVGGVNCKVYLYMPDETKQFTCCVTLDGHEDWIQSLDFTTEDTGDLLLASASQDYTIRLWRIRSKAKTENNSTEISGIKLQETLFTTHSGNTYSAILESVLSGHENWIYSVKWRPHQFKEKKQPLQILSASMDKTMIIWEPDIDSSIWFDKVRVGEVGGNNMGFHGGVFSPDGETILAHGHQGAIHLWKFNKELDRWLPGVAFGGHSAAVQDIDWDPRGAYLLSCSSDQTTRLHAPLINKGEKTNWHELARPQVHGYDMVCISALSCYNFISGGDEKILRVFQAPRSFAENLKKLSNVDPSSYLKDLLPEGASVPSLGLSNKAVFDEDLKKASDLETNEQKHAKDLYPDFYYTPVVLNEPPTEELLIQNTLWPEVQKLYGHPYEVYAVAANHCGTIVASSCKASKLEHAAIILWSASTWKQLGQLAFHTLTVTQLEFSPNDEYLLSVSRDRMWVLYRHFPDQSPPYRKVAHLEKKTGIHTRIIWSCSWSHDSAHFATASRDKKVAIWGKSIKMPAETKEFSLSSCPLEVEDAATAVAFAPCLSANQRYIITIGLENGRIVACTWKDSEVEADQWKVLFILDKDYAHHLTINRLRFSPVIGISESEESESSILQLASCGSDYHIRVYTFPVHCFC